MIKRFFLTLLLILAPAVIISPVVMVSAATPFDDVCQGVPDQGADASSVCVDRNTTDNPLTGKDGILLRAARFLSIIIGIASVIVIIYGSIKYMTSGGSESSVESAKNTILYAVVGMVIALASQGIIIFVINRIN